MNRMRILLIAGLLVWGAPVLADPVSTGIDPETGLKYWEWKGDGVLFRLTQRLPDQTRAFFLARGFDKDSAELFATHCVFQSMFRNIGDPVSGIVRIDLEEWRVKSADKDRRFRVRQDWQAIWKNSQLPQSAIIAFEWSLLPTWQEYAPGDYNWGMTSYGLPPGTQFHLVFSWHRNDQTFNRQLSNIQCAPDIHPEPDAATQ